MSVVTAGALLAGLLVGIVVCYRLLGTRVPVWAAARLRTWRQAEEAAIREETARRSESVLRGRITEQLAPLLATFAFDPADARFLGTPVDFVVFDGLTEVDSGRARALRSITLVDVKTGTAGLSTIQRRIRDCLAQGRVACLVIESGP